ncbi:dynein heavy chain and region D6 of dynein motor-domain-containing protein [Suillus clintonianus]|uniref:dynein heavy chain and region D6 of dynein motor-domain-containing protein n=1 Tax=Suillus clintonianus TaxID=1904413 RepID=UPI001B87EB06|nr:dynein heavy chain and region D6 of dynein motor-domain-containing protein [Suillus clintonianus]KAG2123592.1 dynein heavy chain and region D6 of dynein motor-domain-containing protein [Suillus clintonianus]
MEAFSPSNSSTAAAVTFITFVQDLKRKTKTWGPMIELCANGEKTLERFRYQFPDDWLYSDQLRGEWSAYNEILKRKNDSIQEQLAGLQLKIVAEDKIVENKINDTLSEWEQTRPVQGNLRADTAMNTINVFEGKLTRVQEEYDLVCRAKEALDLELTRHTRLEPVFEELRDLKAVWTALSGVWSQIGELREMSWSVVQPRKLRQQLDGLLTSTRDMPTRMRQYAAFEYIQDVLRGLLKSNSLISDLKSEALKDRHWKQLFKVLRLPSQISLTLMTLGHVYDLDLKKNDTPIREVIIQAQGEMALEEYIKQVKEIWTNYTLDLINYQNKCRLIKGWDDLFNKCSENLNSLTAMKLSPYYKVFEEEAGSWEDKLNRIHVLFDIWVDVQRQWVYLEGIFSGSADIKHLLPVESARFQNINAEFLTVMKKVYKSPFVIDVMNIQGIQKSLERLADLLNKIQKALGEYLERERSSFPRFYFVGDEDLLEIIGNSKDIVRIMKHLKKMFAGISTIKLDEDLTQIQGMASREGEEVKFSEPVLLKDFPKINDWLAKLESMMRLSLADLLSDAVTELQSFYGTGAPLEMDQLMTWMEKYPAQLVTLAVQVAWTTAVDATLESGKLPEAPLETVSQALDLLADIVLQELSPVTRRKCEHLITELVHQRDVTRTLIQQRVTDTKAFTWLSQMRFYLDRSVENPLDRLAICVADASFPYGWEYLGVPDRLVQTPLTDRVYLTLTQALDNQLGGSPFGPAGTGKTESVKALGVQLGRFVLVFCCDETFDFQAMGRIFVGLCQVGAWGCFDEFNRLEERILSAVSQQVQSIQQGLVLLAKNPNVEIELVGKSLKINKNIGIFITTNPNYAGRSQLPPNLTKLFRPMAMTRPDRELIAQVMLFSQGFRTAESLASKIVPFFNLCDEQLSPQPHYDFGLRALKAVLASAGILKRERLQSAKSEDADGVEGLSDNISEQIILIQSVTETIVPKLVADDVPLLTSLLADVFPGTDYVPVDLDALREQILKVCAERRLVDGDRWVAKILQLYQIQKIQHGLMMVGPSGTGKTNAWQVLLAALERLDGIEGIPYVIDPKAMHKDALYGTLDPTTREWNDGLFTHILRKIVDDVRGESSKRHWIIFDGDVDPEWVENLNSVLDDNKLLTLPNGERLNLPPNVRIMFEVEHLRYATLATVSRCGMIWFSEDVIEPSMVYRHYLNTLSTVPLDADDEDAVDMPGRRIDALAADASNSANLATQVQIASILERYFGDGDLVDSALTFAESIDHIMDFTSTRALHTLFSLLNKTARNVIEYNLQHSDFPLAPEKVEQYVTKRLLVSIIWAFSGDAKLDLRAEMGYFLRKQTGIDLPAMGSDSSLIDFDVQIASGDWIAWQSKVPSIEIDAHAVTSSDIVVPTMDTVRHEEVLYSWLSEHKPLMLCGPPGSGKTMTLFSALRKLPDMEVVGLNFSSATTPELILKTFEQYCEYRKTPNGVILAPVQIGRWLVVFCDEINLPAQDKYGTQRVISFLRQLVECGGYWRAKDMAWVKLERIQFVGACNPPTDPGRVPLSHRFLRHAPLVMVDYPGEVSLKQIYGTYNRALLKVVPTLRAYAEPLTDAMVAFYLSSQKHFTTDIQAHYVYSPRELTRWVRGIYEAIRPLETLSVEGLVRVWAHEALRLFQDRLVTEEEKGWTDEHIDNAAMEHFPTINRDEALHRPILFSNWTSKYYIPVDREELREYTKARLRVFYEEELDVPLVLFNDVLDHVLRIDRVFRQVQGHLLLIGVSGSGKTTLSRFVAWLNGLSIFQIKVSNKYTGDDFDDDLRTVLRRSGCKGEKVCFIMDESNVLDSGFLERMNTLLANAEVPGLFEGDEHAALMTACKEGSQRDGLMLDSHEELYRWFTQQVAKNLHVVFTMNPPENGLASRAATSPALFNRCVLDWFGDWSDQAFYQVGMEFTHTIDLDLPSYAPPALFPIAYRELTMPPVHRTAVVNALVYVHSSLHQINQRLSRRQGRYNYVTPRHYLDFINQYVRLFNEKRDELEEQQRHLHVGLDKLKDTVTQVEELRKSLAIKRSQLQAKDAEANEKLRRMVADQQEAEQKKTASIEIQAALVEQDKNIAQRRSVVMADLADAEPAVLDAQSAVSSIKRQHLQEVRTMANPPEAVKLAMESVCTLLGHKIDSWRTVQGIIRRDDFIQRIVNFDTTSQMTKPLRELMKKDFLSRPSFNFETVQRASKACGPLVKWVLAQVRFSEILDKVEPLRNEVQSLESQADMTKKQASQIITIVAELESKIATYKEEYALLISETQAIKSEMERVQSKVDRSMKLLESLSSEKGRWESGSRTFDAEMSTIVGDVLLSAAFLAYGGFFDQHYREVMWQEWSSHLHEASIKFKPELSLTEYLSTADDRLSWQSKSLPSDNLTTENAIMLKRFNRYPLIIDPTGQATTFLLNEYKDRKITVTSFLDEAFLKVLESALRFGNPLLIQDVEHLDPILNAVLNREIRRTGGRVLIRLGSQDIDFSPSFTMFLSTRDPSVEFSPDICSRVTFVNFTMTRSSLQSQSLDQVLKVERPDTERKRTDLMKAQGEFRLRLRTLEKLLLQALNDSTGNILDDDKVISTLETLKREAADITHKVEETDIVMKEVEQVTAEYLPLAQACSSVFFILEQLNLVNHFYQFSLRFFLDIFDYVLHHNPNLKNVSDHHRRREILLNDLFLIVYKRTSRALLHRDHVMLAVLLAQVKLRGMEEISDGLEFLLESGQGVAVSTAPSTEHPTPSVLTPDQMMHLESYAKQSLFKPVLSNILEHPDDWIPFLQSSNPESIVPTPWEPNTSAVEALRSLLIVKCLRPDRLLQSAALFVRNVFQSDLSSDLDLSAMVANEVPAATPLALVSVTGYDASYRVENLIQSTGARSSSVAMGSQEGFTLADQAIAAASRQGTWVLLKNVHLAPTWLGQLEKKLQTLNPHRNFRLFLTLEANPSIPVNILRQSRIIMNEPLPGIKANLLDSLGSITPQRLAQGPSEKIRLYFLLAWFHAVVQERLRYVPLGWSKTYDFNDSDMSSAFGTIDTWLNAVAKGRANVDPATIPWDALRTLIKQSVYGGRVDSDFDQRILDAFVDKLFTPAAYNVDFDLVPTIGGDHALQAPDGTKLEHFMTWVQRLPDREPPAWLSLPPNAERVIAVAQGNELLGKLRKMRTLTDDDELGSAAGPSKSQTSQQPAWMRNLHERCREWLTQLPSTLNTLPKQSNDNPDPLYRLFFREASIGRKLLDQVCKDLADVVKVCDGELKQTNHLRTLMSSLTKGTIPPHWKRYKVPKAMSVSEWIPDLARRLSQLNDITSVQQNLSNVEVWLGGLFFPEAYITATRQAVAHRKRWSLETLHLRLDIGQMNDPGAFIVDGLVLEGAAWDAENEKLALNDGQAVRLNASQIRWVQDDSSNEEQPADLVTLPVYLNNDRSDVMFTVDLPFDRHSASLVAMRAVCLTARG